MRLTLRTLLAYLDDTLDPRDREILRDKLERSGQATQLVQAIRACITNPQLSAPAPESVHPIEDANMMSDYLDSTLSPEQTAELEKACLDSLPSLAEAGACHQILTMVLGQPAKASDELRSRIFAMVDEVGNVRATEDAQDLFGTGAAIAGGIGPRYSSIELSEEAAESSTITPEPPSFDIPDEATIGSIPPSVMPPPSLSDQTTQVPHEVKPVDAGDSGVFQAATKLREQSEQFAVAANFMDDGSPLAGSRPLRELERSDFYEGDIRPSRITPWLVSLALVGVLLFAISKVFAPMMGPQASKTTDDQQMSAVIEPSDEAEVVSDDEAKPVAPDTKPPTSSDSPSNASTAKTSDEPETEVEVEFSAPPIPMDTPSDKSSESAEVDPEMVNPAVADEVTSEAPPVPPSIEIAGDTETGMGTEPEMGTVENSPDERIANADTTSPATDMSDLDPTNAEKDLIEKPASSVEDVNRAATAIAKLVSDNAMVAMQVDDDWKLVAPDADILTERRIACGPEYRATFTMDKPNKSLTLVGASQVVFRSGTPDDDSTISIDARFGRGIVQLADAGDQIVLRFKDIAVLVTAESEVASFGYQVDHQRLLGIDPMIPENHKTEIQLFSIAGDLSFKGQTIVATSQLDCEPPGDFELAENESVSFIVCDETSKAPAVAALESLPSWVDPEFDTGSLEAQAASDLLELVRSDKTDSLTLSLRVALGFRRNEVAALAGKTMLALNDASAYFGVDGLLSVGKQRLYWSSHLDAIRDMLDRSVDDAAAVRTAIAGQNEALDNADGDTLFKLLVGYSQDQLKTGGDAELVSHLESASIPVRVLASEHLRDISGTTLFFRPEEVVESRREDIVKKWKVRLKKESIRYPEAE
ncbi:hypothetical protein LOC67_13745 [Stieleria sp. JC731]|uniref:hypothetical protein n=1 Tax=Pirellulaceae TaxID=2691357 RepID=UPI001E3B5A63|nr:hypothetical protein [Stieleria sp. JC731]MCC9601616.1 hypothetical protein [Stieleria sp. JC731]